VAGIDSPGERRTQMGKKTNLKTCVAVLVFLLAVGCAAGLARAADVWDVTMIEDGWAVGAYTSVAILPSDQPAISYYDRENRDLKYACFDGNDWETSIVDSNGDVGSHTSLAILPSGQPAISYYDATNGYLKFAWFDGSVWHPYSIDSDGDVGQYTSLEVPTTGPFTGQPMISYYGNDNLKFTWVDANSTWVDANSWERTTVDEPGNVGLYTSLEILPSGQPAISYYDTSNDDLKYAELIGENPSLSTHWQKETVDEEGNVGLYTSLEILTSGRPAISYYDATNDDLKYACYDGNEWPKTIVDSAGNVGMYTSLKILPVDGEVMSYFDEAAEDLSGQPVISYFDDSNDDLKFAWFDGSEWQTTIVHYGGSEGHWSSLAILPSGQPAISYHDASNGELKYAWFEGFGWYKSTVDDRRIVGEFTSLVILPSGQPAISYHASDPNYDLKYTWFNGNDWQMATVDSDGHVGTYTSLAVPKSGPFAGQPAISYYSYYGGRDLKYAWHDSSIWHTTVVDDRAYTGRYSSLEFLPSGHPAISYESNADLKYAKLVGNDPCGPNNWEVEFVDSASNVGYYTSLAILPSGQPAISYHEGDPNYDLKYAEYDGNDWDVNTVDSEGNAGEWTSLAVLKSGPFAGQPAISYFSDWNLKYAWRDGSIWHTTIVDNSSLTGRCTSLAILPSGHPAISYQGYEGDWCLKYAELIGSDPCNPEDWKQLIVDDGYPWYTSLAILPSGQPSISYYDDTAGDLKYVVGPHLGDINIDGRVNFIDFSFFASAWRTEPGDAKWNPECDISIPADNSVDMLDLAVFVTNWLAGVE